MSQALSGARTENRQSFAIRSFHRLVQRKRQSARLIGFVPAQQLDFGHAAAADVSLVLQANAMYVKGLAVQQVWARFLSKGDDDDDDEGKIRGKITDLR